MLFLLKIFQSYITLLLRGSKDNFKFSFLKLLKKPDHSVLNNHRLAVFYMDFIITLKVQHAIDFNQRLTAFLLIRDLLANYIFECIFCFFLLQIKGESHSILSG